MFSDIDRMVLLILWKYENVIGRKPTMKELSVKTGRAERDFPGILNRLQRTDLESVRLFEGWERPAPNPLNWWDKFR